MFSHVCWHRRPDDAQHSFTSVGNMDGKPKVGGVAQGGRKGQGWGEARREGCGGEAWQKKNSKSEGGEKPQQDSRTKRQEGQRKQPLSWKPQEEAGRA